MEIVSMRDIEVDLKINEKKQNYSDIEIKKSDKRTKDLEFKNSMIIRDQ